MILDAYGKPARATERFVCLDWLRLEAERMSADRAASDRVRAVRDALYTPQFGDTIRVAMPKRFTAE